MHNRPIRPLIGSSEVHLDVVHSTNDYAMDIISKTDPIEGLVVSSDHQVGGKGQYGRKWLSAAGLNITLSVILKPVFIPLQEQFALNIFSSLAILDVLFQFTQRRGQIKWPNDIVIDKKKICGILIQNVLLNGNIRYAVVGIGLNVNQTAFEEELRHAVSLKTLTGEELDLQQVKKELYSSLNRTYHSLQYAKDELYKEYESNLLGLNKMCSFKVNQEVVRGEIRGIDPTGYLLVEHDNQTSRYSHSEIQMVIY